MINKVISATKLFRVKIVELVCASLDLGAEGIHHAIVVVSESLDLGDKGENPVAVVVSFNSGSIQRADTVSCSPESPVVVVASFNSASIQRANSVSCSPQKKRIAPARRSVMAMLVIV